MDACQLSRVWFRCFLWSMLIGWVEKISSDLNNLIPIKGFIWSSRVIQAPEPGQTHYMISQSINQNPTSPPLEISGGPCS
jgi:hypothetical protein